MFPVSDFNFMVAGIATFAATVGYTYARGKHNSTTTGLSDNVETRDEEMSSLREKAQVNEKTTAEAGPSSVAPSVPERRGSLKRKEPHDGFEEEEETQNLGYPHNLAHIYPRKRCRTPSSGKGKEKKTIRESTPFLVEDSPTEDWVFVHNVNSPNAVSNEPPRTPSPGAETSAAPTPATEVMDSPLLITTPIPEESTSKQATPVMKVKGLDRAPTPIVSSTEEKSETAEIPRVEATSPEPIARGIPEPSEQPAAFGKTSAFTPVASFQKISHREHITSSFAARGFADFAGDKSPFGSFTALRATPKKSGRPAWLSDDTVETSGRSESNADVEEHVLTQAKASAKLAIDQATGEENENIEVELKGVRLYVKRGDRPFAEGIAGHCKVLKDRTSRQERLLFRREPLWKISMNVRLGPSTRCTWDAAENVLRIVTQEPKSDVTTTETSKSSEIVVYAMKPGRSCSKQDFEMFSEALIKNPRLKPSVSA
ncbi:hypothetical protein AN958_10393 [Leucoagaricus sp. SymC.cos]|nr:hypothetical protein AN958_10393 [Leucoagaricus sp. SymC.cos]